jgi:hypothetical protein
MIRIHPPRRIPVWIAFGVGAVVAAVAAPVARARAPASSVALLQVRPGQVLLPSDHLTSSLSQATIQSARLRAFLDSCEAIAISRAYPKYKPADSVVVNRTGEIVRLPDRSNVFLIELPTSTDLASFLSRARKCPEVVTAGEAPVPVFCAVYPNDSLFARGDQWVCLPIIPSGGETA